MKKKKFNYFIVFLIVFMIFLRIINKVLFYGVNDLLWMIMTIILFIFSIFLSFKFKFVQFRFGKMIKCLFKKDETSGEDNITSLESLSISMAARIGVGSLSGIAIAIYLGGPGVIFWMWISSLILSILTYVESYLGVKFQINNHGKYLGGPFYYIKDGLGNRSLSLIYAVVILFAYIVGFLGIQSNTIVKSVVPIFDISPVVISLILCIFTMVVIFRNTKVIVSFTSKLVPLMGFIYILLGVYIIFDNFNVIDDIFRLIIKDAFTLRTGFVSMILIGIQKGLFASENGLGSSAIAAGGVKDNPSKQGMIQLFGVHFTTLIICTITAFIVLNSNYSLVSGNINGIEIITLVFYNNFGLFGSYLLCLITILFAFSTIISGYFYGEVSLKYLNSEVSSYGIFGLKIFSLILIFLGGVINSSIIWTVIDLFILVLTIINCYSIYKIIMTKGKC